MVGLERMQADYEQTLEAGRRAAERLAAEAAESDGERSSGPHDAAADGYTALGSDDSEGENADGNDGEGEGAAALTTATGPGVGSGARDASSGPGTQRDSASVLEDFADFSGENPALPPPPADPPQLMATPLTHDDVQLIKMTMQKVCLPPPRWAENLSDDKLESMVRELSKTA